MAEVKEYVGPLRSVVEKGQYEKVVTVCGDEVLLHIAKVHEEQAVNDATSNVPLLDRDYEKWVQRLSRCVTRVNGHVFPSVQDSMLFFKSLTQPHIEEYVTTYDKMVDEVRKRFSSNLQEIKNS